MKAARERSEKSFKEWKLLKAERAKVDPKDRGRMDTINRRMDELTAEMDKADAEWREANLAWTKRMNRGADSADDLRARMHRALDRAIDHARRRGKDANRPKIKTFRELWRDALQAAKAADEHPGMEKLKALGIRTMKDVDAYAKKHIKKDRAGKPFIESRYGTLKDLVGEAAADRIMRALEVQSWEPPKGMKKR